jgi:putative transport protein
VLALAGRQQDLVGDVNPLRVEEVDDRELLNIPIVSGDIVITQRAVAGRTFEALVPTLGPRGVFLLKIQRGGQEIPVGWQTVIERGDVLTVTGHRPEIERVAAEMGYAEWPTTATDLVLVGGGIFLGGLLGLLALPIGRIEIGLSLAVGVLLAGLVLGHLRAVNPRFGRIPEASLWLFDSLGLTAFLALVGLGTGPAVVSGLLEAGPRLLLAALVLVLVPHAVTILAGYYLLKVNPGILLGVCAGAGTSAPALAAVQEAAKSKVPALGYGMACALGNVLLALWATLAVLLLPH